MTAKDCLWLPEATRGTYETINAAVMMKFGLEPEDNAFPLLLPFQRPFNTNKTMGSRTATFTQGNKFLEGITVSHIPVNGLDEYYLLGDSSTSSGTHTITAHATTAKPSMTMYRQGYSATEKRKVAGCVAKSLQVMFKPGRPITHHITFDSITDAVTTDAPGTPEFPGTTYPNGGTQITSPFDVKSTFTANAAAYTYEEIGWNWAHAINPYGNNAGKRRGIVDTEPVILTCTANLQGDVTALRTLADAGTGHTVVWKVLKSADTAKYIQYSCTMYITDIADKLVLDDATDRGVVTWIGSNPTVTCLDGLDTEYYGD